MIQNIALLGKAGSGKTELAKSIEDTHVKLSFATPVKELSVIIYNTAAEFLKVDSRVNIDQFYNSNKPYFRTLMQVVGTEIGREYFGANVWVDVMRPAIEYHMEQGNPIVVDDVRFVNEYMMLEDLGFKMIMAHRPNLEQNAITSKHISEKSLYKLREIGLTIIENDGTLEELKEKFQQVIR